MKTKWKGKAARVWVEVEDGLVPALRLTPIERALYGYLVRHTRITGKRRLRCSRAWLAHGTRTSGNTARKALRSLADKRALRILERGHGGHMIEVLLPREIPGCKGGQPDRSVFHLEKANFFSAPELRRAIFERDGNRCFYCRRELTRHTRALDHVVPRAGQGRDSYRNLAACCLECNTEKRCKEPVELLRKLYRERRLSGAELAERLRALKALRQGKLKPKVPRPGDTEGTYRKKMLQVA